MTASPLSLMLAIFYLNCGRNAPVDFKSATTRLHTDAYTRDIGTLTLTAIGKFDTGSPIGINLLMMELGRETAELVVDTEILVGIRDSHSREMLDGLISSRAPYRPSDLDINGNDLIEIGCIGADIGKTMRLMLKEVIEGKLTNSRRELLSRAREIYGGK